jgi:hypothetical protein
MDLTNYDYNLLSYYLPSPGPVTSGPLILSWPAYKWSYSMSAEAITVVSSRAVFQGNEVHWVSIQ